MPIEIMYIHSQNYSWYKSLEISLSNEYHFKKTDDEIDILKKNEINLFNEPIINLSVMVGENGVGKSTILNTIFKLLNSQNKDLIMILKTDNVITVLSNGTVHFSMNSLDLLGDKYSVRYKSFKEFAINQTTFPIQTALFSNTLDTSLVDFTSRYKDIYRFNYTPLSLINQPSNFLDCSMNSTLELPKDTSTYLLINKLHQVSFLSRQSLQSYDAKEIPDSVKFEFHETKDLLIEGYTLPSINHGGVFKILIYLLESKGNDLSFPDMVLITKICSLVKKFEHKSIHNQEESKYSEGIIKFLEAILDQKPISKNGYSHYFSELLNSISDAQLFLDGISLIVDEYVKMDKKLVDSLNKDFNLKEAGEFVDYLTSALRDNLFATKLLPYNFFYSKNGKEFRFSTGEEQLLRLYTYIDLVVNTIKKEFRNSTELPTLLLLIDEPDNSLNPQLQKKFIQDLNDFLVNYSSVNFQVIITTHSPIITSDLISNHLILLEREKEGDSIFIRESNIEKPKTFAENIYRLYQNAFFIEGGLTGDFANNYLNNLYGYLKSPEVYPSLFKKLTNDQIKNLISEIGEPLIRMKFEKMHRETNELQLEITKLLSLNLSHTDLRDRLGKLLKDGPNYD